MVYVDDSQVHDGWKFNGLTKDGTWGQFSRATVSHETRSGECLNNSERDRLYRRLLDSLTLHPDDRADLAAIPNSERFCDISAISRNIKNHNPSCYKGFRAVKF